MQAIKQNQLAKPSKSQSFLSKLGNFVGNTAGVLSKVLPGVGGTVAKVVANLLNDPEWWMHSPGDPVTLNQPLSAVTAQGLTPTGKPYSRSYIRSQFAEFLSPYTTKAYAPEQYSTGEPKPMIGVITPTAAQINKYVIKNVRKVVNAVPLAELQAYMDVFIANATLYAVWQHIKKLRWIAANTPEWMTSFDDPAFPLLRVDNAEALENLEKKCYEALHANVRLPHTLCCYLAWRYGRVYKSTNSRKAAFIMYNPVSIHITVANLKAYISKLIAVQSYDATSKLATADLFNTYEAHDQEVYIKDSTQYTYDKKEWMLRINLSNTQQVTSSQLAAFKSGSAVMPYPPGTNGSVTNSYGTTPELFDGNVPIIIDSELDNPTVFMSSTVSTIVRDEALGSDYEQYRTLFPVVGATAYYPLDRVGVKTSYGEFFTPQNTATAANPLGSMAIYRADFGDANASNPTQWFFTPLSYSESVFQTDGTFSGVGSTSQIAIITILMANKGLDCYNNSVYIAAALNSDVQDATAQPSYARLTNVDLTAIDMDMAFVPEDTIQTELDYAFNNLTWVKYTRSESRSELLKPVDTAVVKLVDEALPQNMTIV